MKRCFVTLAVLLSSFFLLAMSGSPKEDPKITELLGPKVEIQPGDGFISLDELHRIGINFYKYNFEEEHEWKGMKRDVSETVIRNIVPIKEEGVIIAYSVNYNPEGHIVLLANKEFGAPIDQYGSKNWKIGINEGYISSLNTQLHPMVRDGFHRYYKALKNGENLTKEKDIVKWKKFNVPVDSFNERIDYENNTYKPDWWLEKKKSKNTEGIIKTEWHQRYPFYNSCPVQSDTTLVGCNPLAMSQLMKYYSYPPKGLDTLSSSTYDWSNMLAYDSLMTTSTYRNAVAKICFDAGVATNAIWGTDSTSVFFDNIPSGLGKNFNYTAQLKSNASWEPTIDVWIFKLINSIGEGKPVIYGGSYSDANFSGKHTWIVDNYNSDNDYFHFNMGWKADSLDYNNWYPPGNILTSHYAVFNIIPDKNDNYLSLPYKEDFQGSDVVTGTEICQIPKNIGVSHTVAPDSTLAIFTREYDLTNHLKAMNVRNYGENNQWFIIKKINLTCDSVPVLKFSYYINDQNGLTSGTDAIIVEVSNDNRETWNQIYKLDQSNYLTANYKNFVETYVSLKEYKGSIANIRFRFPYSGSEDFCLIDDIEVNSMSLSYPELTNNIILPSKTAQSIKVQPSFGTPPKKSKSINNEVLMDFYIKQDYGVSEYTLAYTDSVLENGIYEYPDWNTKSSLGIPFKIRAVARSYDNSSTITSSEVSVKIKCEPTIEAPLPGNQYYTRNSGGKESITDTLAIKVKVPEVLGSYPNINIKIDDTYVNPGDIVFDSTEGVWVYKWALSTVSPTELGKRYNITSEIDGDPTDYAAVGIYLVEAVFYEDFQIITDLTTAGWTITHFQSPPPQTSSGWVRGPEPGNFPNKGAKTYSTNSTSFSYQLWSPAFTIPANASNPKLEYKIYYVRDNSPESYLFFDICNTAGDSISSTQQLAPINGGWTNIVYDLSSFAGQTIKLHWEHLYNKEITGYGLTTTYLIDNVLVYSTPDIEAPEIDFIAGNIADLDEDMNLNLQFNDNSGIGSVTADYSIEGDSNTITLYPVKGTFNYTGVIPARDHECSGTISFKIKDSVGNETISGGHGIYWALSGGGTLAAPVNVIISQPTSTTISITWDLVTGATGYKIYSSLDPYGTFTEDTLGTFTESRKWEKALDGNKYFYYVTAVNATKFDVEAIKEEELEIAKAKEKVSDR
jgi:hypothetical protein